MNRILLILLTCLLFSCNYEGKNGTEKDRVRADTGTTPESFEELGQDREFQQKHDLKEEIKTPLEGEMINIPVKGGENGRAYLVQDAEVTNRYLFVFHEWWGLNRHMKVTADQYYDNLTKVNVMAVDLFDGKIATNKEVANRLMTEMNEERGKTLIRAALKLAGKEADVATIGWCFGGGWSLKAALLAGDQANGCVMFYGMPVKDEDKLEELQTEVLFVWAKQDDWINRKVVNNFSKNMKATGKELEVISYDADHAFANPSGERYNKSAAIDATNEAMKFLRGKF